MNDEYINGAFYLFCNSLRNDVINLITPLCDEVNLVQNTKIVEWYKYKYFTNITTILNDMWNRLSFDEKNYWIITYSLIKSNNVILD